MRSACAKALVRLALPLLLCSTQGCSADKGHLEKQLSKLEGEVRHLQSETDRMGERLDAFETRSAAASHNAEERAANNGNTVTRPKLKIVHVEPGADEAAGDGAEMASSAADASDSDDGPRVLIQGEGKSIESRTLPVAAPMAAKTAPVATKTTPATTKAKSDAKSTKTEAASSK